MQERGYKVAALKGGIDAWRRAEYPMEPIPASQREADTT